MAKGPQIGAGDIIVTLGDQEYTLHPTLKASQQISRRCGGIVKAVELVQAFDIDTITAIVVTGLGINNAREIQDITNKIWDEGINVVAPRVIDFLGVISNGGRPFDTSDEDEEEIPLGKKSTVSQPVSG